MNQTPNPNPNPNPNPDTTSDVPWPTHDMRNRVPDTSMTPGSETAPSRAAGMLKHAAQGAHDTIDRLADGAAPVVQKLGERVSTAAQALHVKTDQLREAGDEWVQGARTTVRNHPLTWLAAAVAAGALIARMARSGRHSNRHSDR